MGGYPADSLPLMSDQQRDPARSFGNVADAYDPGRPTYPLNGAAWLTADHPVTVLELGAGTGKLTRQLVALGHDVHATDPDPEMLTRLEQNLPDVRVSCAPAEEIPAGDRSYDVVVSAQAFHWFDLPAALREIGRVLRPRGRLGLVWNARDTSVPWVAAIDGILAHHEGDAPRYGSGAWRRALDESATFTPLEHRAFRYEQLLDADGLVDRILSVSFIAVLPEREQSQLAGQLRALVAGFEELFVLPYRTDVFWATRR